MKSGLASAVAASLLASVAALHPATAQQPTAELQALDDAIPGRLINDPGRLDWDVFGPGATSRPIKQSQAPGGGALQITIPAAANTLYAAGTNAPITAAIKAGQRVTVAFYARTLKADTPDGQGIFGVRFQQNAAPYPGFGDTRLAIGSDWALHEVTALAERDIAAGEAVVAFQLSGAKQTIEIGQTIVVEGVSSIIGKGGTTRIPTPLMPAQLEGRGTLLNDPANTEWGLHGTGVAKRTVAAKGMPGDSATLVSVSAASAQPQDIGLTVPVPAAIAQGDVLIVAVLARSIKADTPDGLGRLGIRVQHNRAPYPGFGDQMLSVGPNWKLFQLRTGAKIDIPAGEAGIALHFGAARQDIEIGRVYVLREPAS